MENLEIYGTLGPSCCDVELLTQMFEAGMTGIRLNLSHSDLKDSEPWIRNVHRAAAGTGIRPDILIDMVGPELRSERLEHPLFLQKGQEISFRSLPVSEEIKKHISVGREILLDDGKIVLERTDVSTCLVKQEGKLDSCKTIRLPGVEIESPALTPRDIENLKEAEKFGITGIMQPFVRSAEDLLFIRRVFNDLGISLKIYAKIENEAGIEHLESFFEVCDQIVIARGDLGSSIGLVKLPGIQRRIEAACRKHGMPYMVVTEMLYSMQWNPMPSRAEANDIYDAVVRGAHSIMLTGETAKGKYPLQAMRYFSAIAKEALADRNKGVKQAL